LKTGLNPIWQRKTICVLHVNAQFILAFYMVHEGPRPRPVFGPGGDIIFLKSGRFMMVEPPTSCFRKDFQKSIALAEASGLVLEDRYKDPFRKTAVFCQTRNPEIKSPTA
jgi:hypothetical protein